MKHPSREDDSGAVECAARAVISGASSIGQDSLLSGAVIIGHPLSVVLAVEQTFGLEFSAQEIEPMISVDRITTLVETKCTDGEK